MKRWMLPLGIVAVVAVGMLAAISFGADPPRTGAVATPARTNGAVATPARVAASPQSAPYVLLAWNDLGMHCINPQFSSMAILPPYNTIQAVVIQRGEEPRLVRSATLSYSIDGNTTVAGKTDFWQFAQKLYGKSLRPGFGLAGFGLSGTMKAQPGGYFEATGVPVLPLNDNMGWNPYQHASISMKNGRGHVIAHTNVTVPVSDEMNCAKCHDKGGAAAQGIDTGSVATNILKLHDLREKTGLIGSQPVNCAKCHADNALGAAGNPNLKNLSLAMHGKHSRVSPQPSCYDCHPGAKTQCNRSAAPGMGPNPVTHDPNCASCHGNLNGMASGLEAGRQPWLQEPTCVQCHNSPQYDTGKVLYRKATGHGGILCIACHNSPHAWYPSSHPDDNAQVVALQGSSHAVGFNACYVCHTNGMKGTIPPHGGDD